MGSPIRPLDPVTTPRHPTSTPVRHASGPPSEANAVGEMGRSHQPERHRPGAFTRQTTGAETSGMLLAAELTRGETS